MTSIKQLGDGLPDNLPLLTHVADEDVPDDLPTLTEVVAEGQTEPATRLQPDADREAPALKAAIPASCASNDEEMQRLLRQLETHLGNVFTHKLSLNLEQLQRQAVEQAVSELKAELPELLRNALKARHGL
ncbi:MAG TPA: hypothetical protein VFQ98_01815 [Gallionella sp.]|nr:hypothetical protein [Gallionella sp.]